MQVSIDVRIIRRFVLIAFVLNAAVVGARTWYVEKDGSGDYTVIQSAVNAAASGDTIRIGPGRFDDKQLVTCPGWSEYVRVLIDKDSLTLIGSGPETIIGQEEWWSDDQGRHRGIVASDWWGNRVLRIEDMRLENMGVGLYSSYESSGSDSVSIARCSFYGGHHSVYLIGDGGRVEIVDSEFDRLERNGYHLGGWSQSILVLSSCVFRLWDTHQWSQTHMSLNGIQAVRVSQCEFHEGAAGVSAAFGGGYSFSECRFVGQRLTAIYPAAATAVAIDRCRFEAQNTVIESGTRSNSISMTNSVVDGVDDCTMLMTHAGTVTINHCDLGRGTRGVVHILNDGPCGDLVQLDIRDCFWGTDSPDSIQAWIRDHDDNENVCYEVLYEPFEPQSTPVEQKSLSDLKSLFR